MFKSVCFRVGACLAFVVLLSAAFSHSAVGQTLTGTISGIVSDPSGARVPAAKITIRNLSTNEIRNTTADSAGAYSVTSLQPGPHEVTVEVSGFQKETVTNVQVSQGASSSSRRRDVGRVSQRECKRTD